MAKGGRGGMGGVNLCLLLPSSASMTSNSQARQCSFTSGARETCVGGRQYRAVPVPALCTRYTVHQTICDCSCNCPSQLEYNISACDVYLACGGCRTTGMCGRYEGVAAWVLLGQIVEIVESTNAKRLKQRQPKNICIKSIQDRGAPPLREL
jgi:hypothetical protein